MPQVFAVFLAGSAILQRRVARLQHSIDPMTRRLGWTTSLYLRDIVDPMSLHVERQWKTSRRSLFTIMIARNTKGVEAINDVESSTG